MSKFEKEGIILRPAEPDDFPDMYELRKKLFHEELEAAGVPSEVIHRHTKHWSLDGAVSAWQPWFNDPQYHMRVVAKEGELAGMFIGTSSLEEAELPEIRDGKYVANIQLRPEVRRRGVGRALMKQFMREFGNPEAPTYLHVLEGNKPALGFYRALGFTAIERGEMTIAGSYGMRQLLMRKDATE